MLSSLKFKLLYGASYSIGYFILTLLSVGAHAEGPVVFFSPIIPWPFVLIAIGMLGHLHALERRIFFVGLLLGHYSVTSIIVYGLSAQFDLERSGIASAWRSDASFMVFILAWYLAGQGILWISFLLELKGVGLEKQFGKISSE